MKLHDFVCPLAAAERLTVAVPLANDPDIIQCIAQALQQGLARFLLIGEQHHIEDVAAENNEDISGATFLAAADEQQACALAAEQVQAGQAQVLMKGLVQTSTFTRALLDKSHGFVPEGALISHVAVFEVPTYHKLLIVTDAAINIAPDLEAKAGILQNAVDFARRLGLEKPKVACVTPVEKVKDKIPSTVDADALKRMGEQGRFGDALVDGPFGLDVAVCREAAVTKGVTSEVAGDPDILLLPNLDAANVMYKCLTCFAEGHTASLVAGVSVPVVLTSRADDEETKLLSLALGLRVARADAPRAS